MLQNKFLASIFILLYSSCLFANTSEQAELTAKKFIVSSVLKKTDIPLRAYEQKSFLKNSILVRVQRMDRRETPAWLVVINQQQPPRQLPLAGDLNDFLSELNPTLKRENTTLASQTEAMNYLRSVLNTYGIYNAQLECNLDPTKKNFPCKVHQTEPRSFEGQITVEKDGLISKN